jgi:hypothetical protein
MISHQLPVTVLFASLPPPHLFWVFEYGAGHVTPIKTPILDQSWVLCYNSHFQGTVGRKGYKAHVPLRAAHFTPSPNSLIAGGLVT